MARDTFELEPVSPFRLDLTVWTLRRRPDNVVDRWDGTTYRRVLPLPAGPVEVAVTQAGAARGGASCKSRWQASRSVPRCGPP